jgi:lipopolysaccharide export system ATP-binding protein
MYFYLGVVNKVTIEVRHGEIVGLLGPNGAGKTTAFYMIVGLIKTDQGQIWLDDQLITKQPMHVRAKLGLGYLPQEPSIFRKLTVAENILAILELQSFSRHERKERLASLLKAFHIDHIKNYRGYSLSGGERRRVEIARSLASNPKLILLDEPFAGIDPISISDVKSIIRYLKQQGIGILITDHNVRETLSICDRGYIMNEGKLICEGTAETILNNPMVRDVYLGQEFRL